jgi:hypothetical protein
MKLSEHNLNTLLMFLQQRIEENAEFVAEESQASESLDFKKPSESCIFEFDQKLNQYGTLQAQQK